MQQVVLWNGSLICWRKINDYHKQGKTVFLERDDGTDRPIFSGLFVWLSSVNKVAKLKPAKQALADAIHQNGGWPNHCDCNFATSNDRHLARFFTERPVKGRFTEWSGWVRVAVLSRTAKPLPNWHQTILSRGEYFIAYPEQVKVEVKNETKHQVEVEMKSESEMTINASDWHKNGELPPVGEVCLYVASERLSAEVEITAHARFGLRFVEVGKSVEGYVSKTAALHRFRPLRTEREKAIDEMIKVINRYDYYGSLNFDVVASDIANAMFDEGFRKEVK